MILYINNPKKSVLKAHLFYFIHSPFIGHFDACWNLGDPARLFTIGNLPEPVLWIFVAMRDKRFGLHHVCAKVSCW